VLCVHQLVVDVLCGCHADELDRHTSVDLPLSLATSRVIVDNFSLVYELLGEVMQDARLGNSILHDKPRDFSAQPTATVVSWRKEGIEYLSNKVFVEKVNMLVAKNAL
jgi:hypothetical protein